MNEKPSYLKTVLIGLVMGLIGSIVGFIPVMYLHYQLTDFLVYKIFGSYNTTPDALLYLVAGLPLPFAGILIVPIGGAIFGIIGALVGLRRHSVRIWLWAGIAGLLVNFLVSFWAQ